MWIPLAASAIHVSFITVSVYVEAATPWSLLQVRSAWAARGGFGDLAGAGRRKSKKSQRKSCAGYEGYRADPWFHLAILFVMAV
ncbi:hypothetical protein [Pseudomonas sp. CBC3]|uniref:hypothetical protein n=1 Tax=Pseudomonas sp. CBC3 TaxID=3123318 RepID=UPI0030EA4D67